MGQLLKKNTVLSFLQKQKEFFLPLIGCCLVNTYIFIYHPPVYYIPDLLLGAYLIYKFRDLNQNVSLFFWAGLLLLLGYFFLSPDAPDTEFSNNYVVVLKPFAYICILTLYSRNYPRIDLYKWTNLFFKIYPNVNLIFFKYLGDNWLYPYKL